MRYFGNFYKHIIGIFFLGLCWAHSTLAGEHVAKSGITMVDIPAGDFAMGTCKASSLTAAQREENKKRAFMSQSAIQLPENNCLVGEPQYGKDSEAPQHKVKVSAFQMSKYEITLGQFKEFVKSANRQDLLSDNFMFYNDKGDAAAVVYISWEDAQAFVKWLNMRDGKGWRLPTEAEWEYACRAGRYTEYCGDDSYEYVAWLDLPKASGPYNVGQKHANNFGLHDMTGNASEWVQDCHHENYKGAPANGSAWITGCDKDSKRIMRGGSWFDRPDRGDARPTYRFGEWPKMRANRWTGEPYGFRVARSR